MTRVCKTESFTAIVTQEQIWDLTEDQFADYMSMPDNMHREMWLEEQWEALEETPDPDIDLEETTELKFEVWTGKEWS